MRALTFSFAGKLTVLAMLSVCPPTPALAQVGGNGDYDGDYDVDQDDFFAWAGCMGGQGEYVDPWSSCSAFDFDADLDVDAEDFGQFQAAYLQPTSPTCTGPRRRAQAKKLLLSVGGLVGASARITPFLNIDLCQDSPPPQTFSAVWVGPTNMAATKWAQIGYSRRRLLGNIIDGIYAENRVNSEASGYDFCYNNIPILDFPPCLGDGGLPGAGLPNATHIYGCFKPFHPYWSTWWYVVDNNWFHSWSHDEWFLVVPEVFQAGGEIFHKENDMVGTNESRCTLDLLSIMKTNFEWVSPNLLDPDVTSDDATQWGVNRLSGNSIEIWDKIPIAP